MDPGALALLIPIVAIISAAGVKVAKILAPARGPATDPDLAARLATLEEEFGGLRRELEEAHERLDFTERLLTKQQADRLAPPS